MKLIHYVSVLSFLSPEADMYSQPTTLSPDEVMMAEIYGQTVEERRRSVRWFGIAIVGFFTDNVGPMSEANTEYKKLIRIPALK